MGVWKARRSCGLRCAEVGVAPVRRCVSLGAKGGSVEEGPGSGGGLSTRGWTREFWRMLARRRTRGKERPQWSGEVVVASYSKMRLNSQGRQSVSPSVSQSGRSPGHDDPRWNCWHAHVWRQRNKSLDGLPHRGWAARGWDGPSIGHYAGRPPARRSVCGSAPQPAALRCTTASRG